MDRIIIFIIKILGSITLIFAILAVLLIIITFVIRSILSYIELLKYLHIYKNNKAEIDKWIEIASDMKLYLKIQTLIKNYNDNLQGEEE